MTIVVDQNRYRSEKNRSHSGSNYSVAHHICKIQHRVSFNVKEHLSECKFTDDENVICTANSWQEHQEQLYCYNVSK